MKENPGISVTLTDVEQVLIDNRLPVPNNFTIVMRTKPLNTDRFNSALRTEQRRHFALGALLDLQE
jgi:hypothetical protein